MEKLEDGYYWAIVTFKDLYTGEPEIVFVKSGVNIILLVGHEYYLDFQDVDFGANPEPIKVPDWHFMPKKS